MKLKYVIFKFDTNNASLMLPVIFPDHVTHSIVRMEANNQGDFLEPYSAGFFELGEKKLVINKNEGSSSLNIGPQPNDELWIQRSLLNLPSSFFLVDENDQPMIDI
jgi:hypothetical protein